MIVLGRILHGPESANPECAKEKTAIDKLRPMLDAGRVDAATKLPGQTVGQFYLLRQKSVLPVQVDPCVITTAQVPEDRILEIGEAIGSYARRSEAQPSSQRRS